MRWRWPDASAVVMHTGVYLSDLFLQYSAVCTAESLSCFISVLYLDLYVLGDDALIS